MAQTHKKLTARQVETLSKPGRHGDGGGLYLSIAAKGGRRWVFLYRRAGKLREMGLGSAPGLGRPGVPLADARAKAEEARRLLDAGLDPITEKQRLEAEEQAKGPPTFGDFADAFVAELEDGWKNAKHRQQWANTLKTHAAPLRPMTVDAIRTEDVLKVLKPIWRTANETASRLRGRIERILDAARAIGHIKPPYENPARWKGHLEHFLPVKAKHEKAHHAAMPFAEVPGFMAMLRERSDASSMALELTILCAARTSETLGATLSEFDLHNAIWTVPAKRMKAGVAHRVPLPPRAVEIVRTASLTLEKPGAYVFAGRQDGRPLSQMAMAMTLRRLGHEKLTVHGFRSSFRDWAGEMTHHPREIAEAALAHVVGNAVEQAYRRGDALEKRRALMVAWAEFCAGTSAPNVVQLREGAKRTKK